MCSAYINTNLGPFPKNLLLPTHRKIRYNLYDIHSHTDIHTHTHTQTQSNIIKLENSRIGMQQNSPVSVYKHIIFANLSSTIVIQTKLKGGNGNSLKL